MYQINISINVVDKHGNVSDNFTYTFTFDSTQPTILDISSSTAAGDYKVGDPNIPISVKFSEIVNVTGSPLLNLNSGGSASYASGSGSDTLLFNYVIGANQTAADLDVTSINLNGGTINDRATNTADLSLVALNAANKNLTDNNNIEIDYKKVLRVIKSCQCEEHLAVENRLITLFYMKYGNDFLLKNLEKKYKFKKKIIIKK